MKRSWKAYLDSDVVVSAVISDKGAAALLMRGQPGVALVISNVLEAESTEVVKRMHLDEQKLNQVTRDLERIDIKRSTDFNSYVTDAGDAHVVAGANMGKCGFLITYNLRHYDAEKIMRNLNILIMTPGTFLQYLRSVN